MAPESISNSDSSTVRGVALGLFATDPEFDYGDLVDEIAARGATEVLVVINGHQSDLHTADVALTYGPSVSTIERTFSQIRRHGMGITVMPTVQLLRRSPGVWRGRISPRQGPNAWFSAYRRFMLPLARMASTAGADRFIVGSELVSLTVYEASWRALISELRTIFPGRLTYSANWDHYTQVPFWDALDEIGVTGYFPLVESGEAIPRGIAAWRPHRDALSHFATHHGKPLLITELGYASTLGAAQSPWQGGGTTPSRDALQLQADLLTQFCDAFTAPDAKAIGGFFFWNWFGVGGPRDPGFTPRGKPAAQAVERCLRSARWPKPKPDAVAAR
ncbi:MAG: glycoside hydrolase family 113 [Bradymonadia bacterium]